MYVDRPRRRAPRVDRMLRETADSRAAPGARRSARRSTATSRARTSTSAQSVVGGGSTAGREPPVVGVDPRDRRRPGGLRGAAPRRHAVGLLPRRGRRRAARPAHGRARPRSRDLARAVLYALEGDDLDARTERWRRAPLRRRHRRPRRPRQVGADRAAHRAWIPTGGRRRSAAASRSISGYAWCTLPSRPRDRVRRRPRPRTLRRQHARRRGAGAARPVRGRGRRGLEAAVRGAPRDPRRAGRRRRAWSPSRNATSSTTRRSRCAQADVTRARSSAPRSSVGPDRRRVSARTGDGIDDARGRARRDARRRRRAGAHGRPRLLRRPRVHDQGGGDRRHGDARGRTAWPSARTSSSCPSGTRARIRGLQTHKQAEDRACPVTPGRGEPRRGRTAGPRARRGARPCRHPARDRDVRRGHPPGPGTRARGDDEGSVRRARRGGRGGGHAPVPRAGPARSRRRGLRARTTLAPHGARPVRSIRPAGCRTSGNGRWRDRARPVPPAATGRRCAPAAVRARVGKRRRPSTAPHDRARSRAGHRGPQAHGFGGPGPGPDRRRGSSATTWAERSSARSQGISRRSMRRTRWRKDSRPPEHATRWPTRSRWPEPHGTPD